MDLKESKKLNHEIVNVASEKVKKAMESYSWDNEAFGVMSQALDNIVDIKKICKESESKEVKTISLADKKDAETETTEFEALIYEIAETHEEESGKYMVAITTIIADHMEDMRIMNKRAYDLVMMKLRGLK